MIFVRPKSAGNWPNYLPFHKGDFEVKILNNKLRRPGQTRGNRSRQRGGPDERLRHEERWREEWLRHLPTGGCGARGCWRGRAAIENYIMHRREGTINLAKGWRTTGSRLKSTGMLDLTRPLFDHCDKVCTWFENPRAVFESFFW